jgi:hypothetical protein
VNDHLDEPPNDGPLNQRRGRRPPTTQGGGAVYGLGVIGASVWYCRQAVEPTEYVVAVLKALVWPAILVYHALDVLHGMNGPGLTHRE